MINAWEESLSAIDVLAVADVDDQDDQFVVFYRVDDATIADADSIFIAACEFDSAVRTRVFTK